MLAFVLPEIIDIVSLCSNIKVECERFRDGKIKEANLSQNTRETVDRLVQKAKKLVETMNVLAKHYEDLINDCSPFSDRIANHASGISHWLEPSNLEINEVFKSIAEIESGISLLEKALCSHYDRMAMAFEREKMLADCHKRVFQSIRKHPHPIFETEIDEYSEVVDELSVSYPESEDERFSLNRKILRFPGVFDLLMSLEIVDDRNHLLRLIARYDESKPSAVPPFSNEIVSILPCIGIVDLQFSSERELRQAFIKFFRNGNWLEAYVYSMLDRAGCSTRLLNVNLSYRNVSLEVDVLALVRNRFFIFETKDRGESAGFTQNDLSDIEKQLKKIAKLKDVSIVYVINAKNEHQDAMRSKIEELASTKGVAAQVLFLHNTGIDNLVAKIRASLR